MSNQHENVAAYLARATSVFSVSCYALGFGALMMAIVIDTWGLFMGVAVFTAIVAMLGVLTGIGSLLLHRLSKTGGGAWKNTLGFSVLAAAYVPLMGLVWIGMGFHR